MVAVELIHSALRDVVRGGDGYSARFDHLRFIVSESREGDGKMWLHASVSRRDKQMPTYEDLMALKRYCIGEHRTAYQVFPSKDKHVDWAGKRGIQVLHLWSCLDGDVTPDFRGILPNGEATI